ncbi:MAG: PRTRC system protein C [Chitinophagaceae bacterium]|nr:PRTRC system protein C [Chitinophagaceae bacterium]
MALEVTNLEREFRFKKDGTEVKLPDPNPEFTTNEVLQFYSGQYPELTTATLEGPKTDGTKAVYSVKTTIGTKG